MYDIIKKILIVPFILFAILHLTAQPWENVTPFTESRQGIGGSFISAAEGWIYQYNKNSPFAIYHTTDSARSFENIYIHPDTVADAYNYIHYFQMADDLNGWTIISYSDIYFPYADYNYFMKTSDGGITWKNITDSLIFDTVFNIGSNTSFFFVNRETGFTYFNGCIYKSQDGGITWYNTIMPEIDEACSIYSVQQFFFLDSTYGWAGCSCANSTPIIIFTTDGGETWQTNQDQRLTLPPHITDLHFINNQTGAYTGRGCFGCFAVFTTNNFESYTFNEDWFENGWQAPEAICYQNDSIVWITGEPGVLYRSMDGGANFENYQEFPDAGFHEIIFFDNTGYAFSFYDNYLLKFVDTVYASLDRDFENHPEPEIVFYPNPVKDCIKLDYKLVQPENMNIKIHCLNGKVIYNKSLKVSRPGRQYVTIPVENLNSGIYFISIKSRNINFSKKFMIF